MKSFVREKKIYCGDTYLEVDIYPYVKIGEKGKRAKKKKESLPKQKNLNDKNARRKFVQLVETNFGENDLAVHLTYSDETLPGNIEEAEKEVANFIRRVKRKRKKEGLEELRYIVVTAHGEKKDTGEVVRIHHHILMNGGLGREEIEDLWRKPRKKGEAKGQKIGYANADRIQPDYNTGVTKLAEYLVRNPTSKKRWSASQNLKRPESRTNDYKYSRRKVLQIANEPLDLRFWERKYPGYTIKDKLTGYKVVYNEYTGWSIYLKLRKIE